MTDFLTDRHCSELFDFLGKVQIYLSSFGVWGTKKIYINKRVKMWHPVFHFKDLIWNCENFIAEQFLFFEDESIITFYFWAATWSRI